MVSAERTIRSLKVLIYMECWPGLYRSYQRDHQSWEEVKETEAHWEETTLAQITQPLGSQADAEMEDTLRPERSDV